MPRYRSRRPVLARAWLRHVEARLCAAIERSAGLHPFIPIRTLAQFAHVHLETVALVHDTLPDVSSFAPIDGRPFLTGHDIT